MTEQNAVITSASIEIEDHGILTVWLYLSLGRCVGQGFGGFGLYSEGMKWHTRFDACGHFVWRVLKVAGVSKFSELKGKTIRIRKAHELGKIDAIGHIVDDDWFNPAEDFAEK